jgi:hypothetical protein
MLGQFLVGGAASACNITIHALVMVVVIQVARVMSGKTICSPSFQLISTIIATVFVLMAANTLEVIVWASVYFLADAAPAGASLVYFAFVNYTTLGYGDVVPVERWHLLGPITAMNGVLLFGWSTAVIFEVLRKALERSFLAGPLR